MLMASKINDIYSIHISDLEKDIGRVNCIVNLEKQIMGILQFDVLFPTEIDILLLLINQIN